MGKTYSIRTLPKEGLLVIDAEPANGTLASFDVPSLKVVAWDREKAEKEKTPLGPGEIYGVDLMRLDPNEAKWLVIDSLTGLAEMCLDWYASRPTKSGNEQDGKKVYGECANAIRRVLVHAMTLFEGNIVAFARVDTDAKGYSQISLPGKALPSQVQSLFNNIGMVRVSSSGVPYIDFTQTDECVTRASGTFSPGKYPLNWAEIIAPKESKA